MRCRLGAPCQLRVYTWQFMRRYEREDIMELTGETLMRNELRLFSYLVWGILSIGSATLTLQAFHTLLSYGSWLAVFFIRQVSGPCVRFDLPHE
jgi:hypothetical protein